MKPFCINWRKNNVICSYQRIHTYVGKDAVLEDRILRTSGVIEKYGAVSRVGKVIGGHRAGDYELYNWYETVAAQPVQWTVTQMILTKKIFEERARPRCNASPWLDQCCIIRKALIQEK